MLLLMPASALIMAAMVEMLRLAGVPRKASLKGAYPTVALWIVGGAAALSGQPFSIYSSMYVLAFISAFFGPLIAALAYAYREKSNKG